MMEKTPKKRGKRFLMASLQIMRYVSRFIGE
jgi:hypothetical protein